MKKIIFITLGFLMLGLGFLGVILPILPTTPFLLVASYFFASGSEKFHQWFVGLPIYKKHLEAFAKDRAMTLKTKWSILLPVSGMLIFAMMIVPFFWARVLIMIVFVSKYVYFFTQIKTIEAPVSHVETV